MTAMARGFTLADFDFELPPELIAQHPAAERSASRLLDGRSWPPADRIFRDLPYVLRNQPSSGRLRMVYASRNAMNQRWYP